MYKYLQYLQDRAVAFSSFVFSIKRWDVLETHTFTRTHIRRTTKFPDDGTGKKKHLPLCFRYDSIRILIFILMIVNNDINDKKK